MQKATETVQASVAVAANRHFCVARPPHFISTSGGRSNQQGSSCSRRRPLVVLDNGLHSRGSLAWHNSFNRFAGFRTDSGGYEPGGRRFESLGAEARSAKAACRRLGSYTPRTL